ncbi:MAG: RNA polymerase factor sigma-54 [Planctomycetes bacterium]|nr:RNA polymerase factor sigma-54 [Planctomycetota bacterium]
MKLNGQLSQQVEQRLALMPQMLQSIEILQLSTIGLCDLIERELAQNETLEAVREDSLPTPQSAVSDESFDPGRFTGRTASGDSDRKLEWLSSVEGRAPGLAEHLRAQLVWRELDTDLRARIDVAIDALDARGLLPLDDAELEQLLGAEFVRPVLDVIHSLEPRGIGARSTIEAMLMQVPASDPDLPLMRALLCDYLDELSRNRVPEVARALGIDIDEVLDLVDRIKTLDPRPGEVFVQELAAQIHPDLIVEPDGADGHRVVVDDFALPVLRINEHYAAMVRAPDTERSVKRYLRDKLQSARDLMSAIRQRKETLARVGAAVMAHQRAFLEHGRAASRPLKMSVIADELGVHNSTVSRAIAGKYVQTTHGVFALRDFFDGDRTARRASEGDGAKGRMAVLHAIEQLVGNEDKHDPLSDEQLVERLAELGMELARRTVAKYRKELGIRSSWQRRRHGSR